MTTTILPSTSGNEDTVPFRHPFRRNLLPSILYAIRNLRSRAMFAALKRFCQGKVLDIGGADFFLLAQRHQLQYDAWTTIETTEEFRPGTSDPRFAFEIGDGCHMPQYADASFDTVLALQVLEHVMEPLKMMDEIGRLLRPGGHAVLLAPQTGVLHHAPRHYQNFTRYWFIEACQRSGLEVVELTHLGGWWSSAASRFFYFFIQSARYPGYHVSEEKRHLLFYLMWPLMAVYAALSIPACMLLSIGDSAEEPNNHLIVARKKSLAD